MLYSYSVTVVSTISSCFVLSVKDYIAAVVTVAQEGYFVSIG